MGSTDGNGYRAKLKTLLQNANDTIDYVGSVNAGQMADNQNEGYPGATIAQISGYADKALLLKPSVSIGFLASYILCVDPEGSRLDHNSHGWYKRHVRI